MKGQRYEINITGKDNNYKVKVLNNGWKVIIAEGDYKKVLHTLYKEYNSRVKFNVLDDETRVIEKAIRAFRGYAGC